MGWVLCTTHNLPDNMWHLCPPGERGPTLKAGTTETSQTQRVRARTRKSEAMLVIRDLFENPCGCGSSGCSPIKKYPSHTQFNLLSEGSSASIIITPCVNPPIKSSCLIPGTGQWTLVLRIKGDSSQDPFDDKEQRLI